MEKILRDKKAILVFILPAIIAYTAVVFFPMCQSFYFTFFEGTPNVNFEFVGLQNYAKLFGDVNFKESFLTTMQYFFVTGGGWIVFGLIVALMLQYGLNHFSNAARTIIYLPVVIPGVAAAALFSKVLEVTPTYGLLNSLLDVMGLDSLIRGWTGDSATAMWMVCLVDLWKGIGYYTIIFYAGLINVPPEVEEAARIDGAGKLTTIWKIVLPLLKPVTIMCVVLAIMNSLKVYDMPLVLTDGGPGRVTTVLSIYMYKIAFTKWQYGYGSTIAIVMLVLTIVLTQVVMRLDRKENV
ncbi:carbohydrate ABC transporter permease [Massiliimalia massiliensis]|uniref:carbohydrate ABC transporter permease n=1 Tax=Massiliimalia massiliensis TaxID=1852384 RepID=UPI0009877483|nr:sugar ABC transporter permease [Massiliimalia massiliensis]